MKRKILIPVAATMLVISVFTAGAVMAQENSTGDTPVVQSFASRVATILGLDEAQVQIAMDQARQDMRNEALKRRLDSLVEQGRLTQAQADEYLQWLQSRPEGIPGFGGPGPGFGFGGHGHSRGHGYGHGHDFGMRGPEGKFGAPRGQAPSQDSSLAPSQSSSGGASGGSL